MWGEEGILSRLNAAAVMQYFRTPDRVTEAVARHLTAGQVGKGRELRLLDPCAGEGIAAEHLAHALKARSYGIELNEERAAACRERLDETLAASAMNVRLAGGGWGLLFLNPPYDASGDEKRRLEHAFLLETTRALAPGGVLVFIVPQRRLAISARYLSNQYAELSCYRFPDPEWERFRQVVLFSRRKGTATRDAEAEERVQAWAEDPLPPLPDVPPPGARLYTVPALPEGEITFASNYLDPVRAASEAVSRGAWSDPAIRERLWPAEVRTVRPLMPLRKGHLAMLISSGFVDNKVLRAGDERVLVKGRAYKETVEVESADPDTVVEREVVRTQVTALDLRTGAISDIGDGRGLIEWIGKYQGAIADAVKGEYPPVYTAANRNNWGYDLGKLRRRPKGAQADAIRAAAVSLERCGAVTICGQMGTGKTLMGTAAAWYAGGRRTVVVCPSHLVRKWAREVKETVPGARSVVVRDISELEGALGSSGAAPLYVIISKEMAKLGYAWRPAVTQQRWYDPAQGIKARLVCPGCGLELLDAEGNPLEREDLARRRRRCEWVRTDRGLGQGCGELLWQAQARSLERRRGGFRFGGPGSPLAGSRTCDVVGEGPRRYALADYIRKRCPHSFDTAILDECFPGWTPVSTPTGPVRIQDLRPGDEVTSFADGEIVIRRVTRTIQKRPRQRLVRVVHKGGSFVCTPNHKIHTAEGYVPAGTLTPRTVLTALGRGGVAGADHHEDLSDLLRAVPVLASVGTGGEDVQSQVRSPLEGAHEPRSTSAQAADRLPEDVRVVREAIRGQEEVAAVLLQDLRVESALGEPGDAGQDARGAPQEDAGTPSGGICSDDPAEPRPGDPGSCLRDEAWRVVRWSAGRERPSDAAAAEARGGAWLDYRVLDRDGQLLMAVRDGRHRLPVAQDSGGVRWGIAPHEEAEEPGRSEGGDALGARMDGAEVLERGDRPAAGVGAGTYPSSRGSQVLGVKYLDLDEEWVYDLEVEDTHCYFAAGVLVSNCHQLKAKGSAQGIAAAGIAAKAKRVIALTGTLFGAYSSTLFYLRYRFSRALEGEFGYHDEPKWIGRYGIAETIKKYDGDVSDGAMSKRKLISTRTVEKPGISPAVLFYLVGDTVFVRLEDVERNLPPYTEHVQLLRLDRESGQEEEYCRLATRMHAEVQAALAAGSKRLLGAYLQSLLSYPDACYRGEVVGDPKTGRVLAEAAQLDADRLYPKERELVELCRRERARDRRVLVYASHTGERDITPRLEEMLREAGLRVRVLKASVKAESREDWVNTQVTEGLDVLITNPRCVETGLDYTE